MLAQFSLDAPNVTPNQRERFVGAVGHLLARNDSTPSLSDSSTGLLVDLLVSADPEMVVAGPSVQVTSEINNYNSLKKKSADNVYLIYKKIFV